MYVLIASGGQWEDSWESVHTCSRDKARLEELMAALEDGGADKFYNSLKEGHDEFMDKWDDDNPAPDFHIDSFENPDHPFSIYVAERVKVGAAYLLSKGYVIDEHYHGNMYTREKAFYRIEEIKEI